MYRGICIVGFVSTRMNTHRKPVQHVLKRVVSVVSILTSKKIKWVIGWLDMFFMLHHVLQWRYHIKTTTYLISNLTAFYGQLMEDGESGVPLGAAVLDAKKRESEYVTILHLQEMEPQNVWGETA